jgi:hypothetical protein
MDRKSEGNYKDKNGALDKVNIYIAERTAVEDQHPNTV